MAEPGTRLEAPVVAGGRRVSIGVDLQSLRAGTGSTLLELEAGELWTARSPVEPARGWHRVSFELQEWPVGEPLVLRLAAGEASRGSTRVLLDRVVFDWRD